MVFIHQAAPWPGMQLAAVLTVLAVAVALAVAGGDRPPAAVEPVAGSGAPAAMPAPLAPWTGAGEQVLVATPGGSYDLAIRADGNPLEVVVRMYDGASLGGLLVGPGLCKGEEFSTNVIGLSTSGQVILHAECGAVPAGDHLLRIESGASAYLASVQIANATFQA